jgi:hypothetical protein
VGSKFPNTFLSNSARESIKRKGPRPARARGPNTEDAPAWNEVHVVEGQHEERDSDLHSSEYDECVTASLDAFWCEREPDEEVCPPPGPDSGFSSLHSSAAAAASAGFDASAAAATSVARLAVTEALKDLSGADALQVLEQATNDILEQISV